MKADKILEMWAKFFKDRNEDYGDAYLRFGEIAILLMPEGITLKTADDFYFFHIFVLEIVKMIRIGNAIPQGVHHSDSWKDLAVYAAMYTEKQLTAKEPKND